MARSLRVVLLCACALVGCHARPLPCIATSFCVRTCEAAGRRVTAGGGTGGPSGFLEEACNCAIDCDLGTCHGTPVCAP